MRQLRDVYESARLNIPLKLLPERAAVKPWTELEDRVRSELGDLEQKIQSVVRSDRESLARHSRVIGEFNHGVRQGLFAAHGDAAGPTLTQGPYQWGLAIGQRTRRSGDVDPETVKQFVTATHLLAYEFGQLHEAHGDALGFLLRNVGPQRADELGALAFALPVLVQFRRALVLRLLSDDGFSLADYQASQSPAPSHLEYLTDGVVALFDPSPEGWVRVAANMGLAARPFLDGTTLASEHFQAPAHAVAVVFDAPIASHTVVRRQVDRVLLAREWLAGDVHGIRMDSEQMRPVTLWDVYQGTPGASIRGRDAYFGDVVASTVIHTVSRYFETVIPAEQTGFQFLRRHLAAFVRGFDSRMEGVVDPKAIASAARGRATSEGLRRFQNGGLLIAHVSEKLQGLVETVHELNHALDEPVAFVIERLSGSQESAVAAFLHDLFLRHGALARDLFADQADFALFSATHVKTRSIYDLIRATLYLVSRAVHPALASRDEAALLLSRARANLARILADEPPPGLAGGAAEAFSGSQGTGGTGEGLRAAAQVFDEEFEVLVRIMRTLVSRLHHARVLGKPRSLFDSSRDDGRRVPA